MIVGYPCQVNEELVFDGLRVVLDIVADATGFETQIVPASEKPDEEQFRVNVNLTNICSSGNDVRTKHIIEGDIAKTYRGAVFSAFSQALQYIEETCAVTVVDPSCIVLHDLKLCLAAVKAEMSELQRCITAVLVVAVKAADRIMGLSGFYHRRCRYHGTCLRIERILNGLVDDLTNFQARVSPLVRRLNDYVVDVQNSPRFEI